MSELTPEPDSTGDEKNSLVNWNAINQILYYKMINNLI
jgi:hypothetical protein